MCVVLIDEPEKPGVIDEQFIPLGHVGKPFHGYLRLEFRSSLNRISVIVSVFSYHFCLISYSYKSANSITWDSRSFKMAPPL